MSLTPSTLFSNNNASLPSLHSSIFLQPLPTWSLSNSPHSKYSTSSPAPLSHITHLSSIIIFSTYPTTHNQSVLFQDLQSLTKHHLHLFPPFLQLPPPRSPALPLLLPYCLPTISNPFSSVTTPTFCMLYILLSTTLLLHTPYLVSL